MSITSYHDYKSTHIDWLEEIPRHWELKPLKYCITRLGSGGTPETKQPDYWADEEDINAVPWVSIGDMSSTEVVLQTQKRLTQKGLDSKGLEVFRAGSLLYSIYASLGKVATLGVDAAFNQAILAIEPDLERTNQGFLGYWLRSLEAHLDYYASSNTQANLNAAKVLSYPVALPSHEEQLAIASFLDRETAKIDALVSEQQRLIELLQEKRQAVISHAVTKGLNPNAPMKDSGVEWLGEVPEHWAIIKASWLFKTEKGNRAQELTQEYCAANEGPFPVFSGQTKNGGVMGAIDSYDFDAGEEGAILCTTVGAKAMSVRRITSKFSLSQNCMVISPKTTEAIPRFFEYGFHPLFEHERALIPDHMQPSFRMEDFNQFWIQVPPAEEQVEISKYLQQEQQASVELQTNISSAIGLLLERRSALISAAVTGQIDVRGLALEAVEQ